MRLVDLTDSEDTTDVPDADEVNDSAEIIEVTTTAASEKPPAMSMEKAKALLKQLQVCETRAFNMELVDISVAAVLQVYCH